MHSANAFSLKHCNAVHDFADESVNFCFVLKLLAIAVKNLLCWDLTIGPWVEVRMNVLLFG